MYAQKNYLQIQGRTNPTNGLPPVYTIHDIGCLLTSMCNMLGTDFSLNVDPLALNAFFRDHNVYIDVDDGRYDDLGWQSVTAYAPNVVVKASGTGTPPNAPAIVCFHYRSIQHPTLPNGAPNMINHFCLWLGNGNIIDAWDGQEKNPSQYATYGSPVKWATYGWANAQPVQPPPAPTYSVEETYEPAKWIRLNKDTNLWGMNYRDFDYIVAHPVETGHNAGEIWQVTNKVKHVNGYEYYRREGQVDGFNVADCDDYTPPQPQLEVNDQSGAPEPTTQAKESVAEKIPVKVLPSPVFTPFNGGPRRMTAQASLTVEDATDQSFQAELIKGQPVTIAGTFDFQGHKYYRTIGSVKNKRWLAIPVTAVKEQSYAEDDEQALKQVTDEMLREANLAVTSTRDKAVAKTGSFIGNLERKLHLKK